MKFEIKNRFPEGTPNHIVFNQFIETLNESDNQDDSWFKKAQPGLEHFIDLHNRDVIAQWLSKIGPTNHMHAFTELERLAYLYRLGMEAWEYCTMDGGKYEELWDLIYASNESPYSMKEQNELGHIMKLFQLWAWG